MEMYVYNWTEIAEYWQKQNEGLEGKKNLFRYPGPFFSFNNKKKNI